MSAQRGWRGRRHATRTAPRIPSVPERKRAWTCPFRKTGRDDVIQHDVFVRVGMRPVLLYPELQPAAFAPEIVVGDTPCVVFVQKAAGIRRMAQLFLSVNRQIVGESTPVVAVGYLQPEFDHGLSGRLA